MAKEIFVDIKLDIVYKRDVDSRLVYSDIILDRGYTREEYTEHYRSLGIDVFKPENEAFLVAIGKATVPPQYGEHHDSEDFRTFCYTWYGKNNNIEFSKWPEHRGSYFTDYPHGVWVKERS